MHIGIYLIVNLKNKKKYIGSSSRLERRWTEHRYDLKNGNHKNPYFQKAWDKNGENSFAFSVLEECKTKDLLERESYWIEHFQSYKRSKGYNLCRHPQSYALGIKRSPETIARLKKALGGENHPNWGRKLPRQQVDRMADAQRGVAKPTSGRRKFYWLISPDGVVVTINGLRQFCRENRLSPSQMVRMYSGIQESYKGWRKCLT